MTPNSIFGKTNQEIFDMYCKEKWNGTNWLGECMTEARIILIGE